MEFEHFDTEPLDNEQMRLENEIMKLRLQAEYGAIFPQARTPADDPGDEYVFLKRILQLHQRIANTPPRPLSQILNFGQFPRVEELTDDLDLFIALEEAMEYLEEFNIFVDFNFDYPDRVMYEFITRELPELEVIGAPADDEHICVLYEAFHPNAVEAVKDCCYEFFGAVIRGRLPEEFGLFFCEKLELFRLRGKPQTEILKLADRFLEYFPRIHCWSLEFEEARGEIGPRNGSFGEGYGIAKGRIVYEVSHDEDTVEELTGPFCCYIHRYEGLWWIGDFELFGFSWGDTPGLPSSEV